MFTYTPTVVPVTPSPTSVGIPSTSVTVTDNMYSLKDLSNDTDFDAANLRELVIRWDFSEIEIPLEQIQEIHVYVRVDQQGEYRYLGRSFENVMNHLLWREGIPYLGIGFERGPELEHQYEFQIFALRRDQQPAVGPIPNAGPVTFREC